MLKDGAFHAVDSSELAFRLATIGAFREIYRNAKPVILEPIMNVEVVAPGEFQSAFTGNPNFLFCGRTRSNRFFRSSYWRVEHAERYHCG